MGQQQRRTNSLIAKILLYKIRRKVHLEDSELYVLYLWKSVSFDVFFCNYFREIIVYSARADLLCTRFHGDDLLV